MVIAAATAYVCIAVGVSTLGRSLWITLFAPGALLLTGYWLSGFFYRDPQAWLEQWLLGIDQRLGAPRWMASFPRLLGELLELSYGLVYVVVAGGAFYAATRGVDAVSGYWTLVLTSTLACYAPLPWLRSRPPRVIERHAVPSVATATGVRRWNHLVLEKASVQANTLPSGHVAGAVAAALAVGAFDAAVGGGFLMMAGLIAVASIAGRYHYVVDCGAGAAVAALFSALM